MWNEAFRWFYLVTLFGHVVFHNVFYGDTP